MIVPPITIDSTLIQVTIDDNEGIFCETEDKLIVQRQTVILSSESHAHRVLKGGRINPQKSYDIDGIQNQYLNPTNPLRYLDKTATSM